jgi:hypothetical protein
VNFINTIKKHFYKNYNELYLRCDNRISFNRYFELSEISTLYGNSKKISFSGYYNVRHRNKLLLREYRNNKYISLLEFVLSSVFQFLLPISKSISKMLFEKKFSVFVINKFKFISSNLTFTGGYERLFPNISNLDIEDIKGSTKIIRPNIFIRFRVLGICFRYNIFDSEYVLQYFILNQGFKKINFRNKNLVIEEGRNIRQLCILDYANKNKIPSTISIRHIPAFGRYCYGSKVITSNQIAFDHYKKYNKETTLIKKPYVLDFKKITNSKTNKIGFLVDIGNAGLNIRDKQVLDKFINEFSKTHNIQIIISVHPQELGVNDEYYNKAFDSEHISFKGDICFEEYLNDIDILVGTYSTGLYQAFLAKTPVIIIDLFNDKQMENFVNLSEGLLKYAVNEESFMNCLNDFNQMSIKNINITHKTALYNLGIKSIT